MSPPEIGHNVKRNIRFALVTTPQQWLHAAAIRGICFIEEGDAKTELVFDGNDYMATHVLVYDGDEPIGAARIRWFRDFAKIERTCFRKAYRGIAILKAFAEFGFEHISRKGYTRVITHGEAKYVRLWRTVLGFRDSGKPPVIFDGQEPFYEVWKDIEPSPEAVSLDSSCAVLFRTEGQWNEPGSFER